MAKIEIRRKKFFLPHVYSSLRAFLARGIIPKKGQKRRKKKRNKDIK